MMLVPALLMVSTIRFRSFKTFDQTRRKYPVLILVAGGIALLVAQPQLVLLVLAYGYFSAGLIGLVWQRLRRRRDGGIETTRDDSDRPDTQAV
jgi:CDP-diacylglycerol--serine O-phosphatidyltransferase